MSPQRGRTRDEPERRPSKGGSPVCALGPESHLDLFSGEVLRVQIFFLMYNLLIFPMLGAVA